MKPLLLLIYIIFFIQNGFLDEIRVAIKEESSKELVKYCNATVEIKIDGTASNYSISQAEVVFKKFFEDNPVTSFDYIHQGSSPEGLKYSIGIYKSQNGSVYRIVFFMKKINERYIIDTINFSRE